MYLAKAECAYVQEPVAAVEPRKEIHKADNTQFQFPVLVKHWTTSLHFLTL
jgi:hypothetical protein